MCKHIPKYVALLGIVSYDFRQYVTKCRQHSHNTKKTSDTPTSPIADLKCECF